MSPFPQSCFCLRVSCMSTLLVSRSCTGLPWRSRQDPSSAAAPCAHALGSLSLFLFLCLSLCLSLPLLFSCSCPQRLVFPLPSTWALAWCLSLTHCFLKLQHIQYVIFMYLYETLDSQMRENVIFSEFGLFHLLWEFPFSRRNFYSFKAF